MKCVYKPRSLQRVEVGEVSEGELWQRHQLIVTQVAMTTNIHISYIISSIFIITVVLQPLLDDELTPSKLASSPLPAPPPPSPPSSSSRGVYPSGLLTILAKSIANNDINTLR